MNELLTTTPLQPLPLRTFRLFVHSITSVAVFGKAVARIVRHSAISAYPIFTGTKGHPATSVAFEVLFCHCHHLLF